MPPPAEDNSLRPRLNIHNFGIFYARKLIFGIFLTYTKTFNSELKVPLAHALTWG